MHVYYYNLFSIIEKGPQDCKQRRQDRILNFQRNIPMLNKNLGTNLIIQQINYVILKLLAPHLFREVCWMVEKRGFVGESVFHVCFLMQTPTHLFLGRRLLKHYPKLINDIYMSEEYYGENVLHMSCVAEDPTMVKYLLDQGIGIK